MRYEDQASEETNVVLDGNEYVRCTFRTCNFRFSGGAVDLDDFKSVGCTLEVVGDFDPTDSRLGSLAEAITGEGHGTIKSPPL